MFNERLKERRERAGLSQTDMSKALSITRQAYNHYETGKREPTNDALKKISEILNCSADYLLGIEDDPSSLDEQLDGVEFALYGEVKDMTEAQKRDVLNFIKFLKSQEEK